VLDRAFVSNLSPVIWFDELDEQVYNLEEVSHTSQILSLSPKRNKQDNVTIIYTPVSRNIIKHYQVYQ